MSWPFVAGVLRASGATPALRRGLVSVQAHLVAHRSMRFEGMDGVISLLFILYVLTYYAGMVAFILWDAKIQRKKAHQAGEVDFADRRIGGYLVLSLFCGPLPLVFYFGSTRRSAAGWFLGFGVATGWTLLFGLLWTAFFGRV